MDKKKKSALLLAYRQFMETGLSSESKGPLDQLVDEQVMGFGTTVDEKILGIKGFKKLLDIQKKQSRGLDLKWKIKPFSHTITPDENTAVFADDLYLSVVAGKEKLNMYMRFSVVLNYSGNRWKAIHWHGSKPENVASEKDTFGVETWKEKAEALEKLVAERTEDLLGKNRELEVESSLERVRAVAMGMKQPSDMPDVCKVIARELYTLGVKEIRNVQTAIFNESRGTYMNYEYYAKHDKAIITETSYTNHKMPKAFAAKMLKGKGQFFVTHIKGQKVKEWLKYQKTTNVFIDKYLNTATSLNYYWHSLGPVALGISTYIPLKKEELDLFRRFLNVFELAYRRYLDIEQAEEQAREARIEAAMEKVRAQSLGMHKQEELPAVCEVLFEQFKALGFGELRNAMVNIHDDETEIFVNYDYSDAIGRSITPLDYDIHPVIKKQIRQVRIADDAFSETVFKGRDLESWKAFRKSRGEKEDKRVKNSTALYYYFYSIGTGSVGISTFQQISDEQKDVLKRFRNVFAFAYRRYMDVAQAEAQAREAQIEAALERVRSRAMAMHSSQELKEVALELRKQMGLLGQKDLEVCAIHLYEDDQSFESWSAMKVPGSANEILQTQARFPKKGIRIVDELMKNYSKGEKDYVIVNDGVKSVEWFAVLKEYAAELHASIIQAIGEIPVNKLRANWSVADFYGGALVMVTYGEPDPASRNLLRRSANVFEQAYIRFLDLQKAEAQAREAQIEAALERVRSRSIGMQKSEELKDVIKVVYDQFVHLNIRLDHAGFVVDYQPKADWHFWIADKQEIPSRITHPYFESVWATQFNNAKEKGEELFVTNLNFEEKNQFYNELLSYVPGLPQASRDFYLSCPALAASTVLLENVGLYIENFEGVPYSDDENMILLRFGKVFQQTYTRFLDLKKAEAQAREAQVEAALEKVRSRTMAMQSSNELQETAAVLFQEFKKLGAADMQQVTIGIYNEEERVIDFRVTSWANNGEQENRAFRLDMDEPNLVQPAITAWKAGKKSAVFDLTGEALQGWLNYRNKISGITISSNDTGGRRVISAAYFSKGHLTISSPLPLPEETIRILERFAAVFDGTYTRFLDLEKAEAQVREAQIEAALERVRSRTLAMQRSDELAETAAVLFQQLIALGIEPNRLYISIINSEQGETEFWITDEEGRKVSTAFTAKMQDNATFLKMYEGWKQQQKSLVIDMQGEELQNYFRHLTGLGVSFKGGLEQKRRIQEIAYFSKGFIGMASPEEQPAETLELLERFAAVFNLTFTRFNDLKMAEAHARQAEQDLIAIKEAKLKAEEALSVLQATQKQLVQSEKMASLGELTAGIAHEIQNPLNFVNNFSEVSNELISEMVEEVDKGNTEEVKAIARDVQQNLEKILHHGKRADGIVKGMLQHSRSSSGVKEPTDINALADEYLRLAYHGLRAKDKSFNATLNTEYDETIGTINIIPQDIGRVILNLITNAFYACTERSRSAAPLPPKGGFSDPDYRHVPTVWVSTKRETDKVIISVRDNGPGIPAEIRDKIFQPFFTTKPTGQGTGLGLSLSYDIVKAHGGELRVETKEGKGSLFILELPIV